MDKNELKNSVIYHLAIQI